MRIVVVVFVILINLQCLFITFIIDYVDSVYMKNAEHCIVVTDEVWLELIRVKYSGRYRSLDEVIRDKFGLNLQHPEVKNYSSDPPGNERVAQREPGWCKAMPGDDGDNLSR